MSSILHIHTQSHTEVTNCKVCVFIGSTSESGFVHRGRVQQPAFSIQY